MVALSIMACTHDMSAHTSYLFIVKDRSLTDCISLISSTQKKLIPGAEAGRPLYMLNSISVNNIRTNISVSGLICRRANAHYRAKIFRVNTCNEIN
jgi:hypothetical protein